MTTPPTDLPAVLTITDACRVLGVGKTTVYEQLYAGKLPGFKVGKVWRFRRDVLLAFIEDQEREHSFRAHDDNRRNSR